MTKYPDDPFSNSIRKRLLWSELLRFTHELSVNTLTQAEEVSKEALSERSKELDEYELEYGFVYFGEKHWLKALNAGLDRSYSEWVEGFLLEQKRICWGDPEVTLYQAPLEITTKRNEERIEGLIGEALLPPLFPEKGQRFSQYCEGMRFIIGPRSTTNDRDYLVQAYHVLHNFPYYAEKAIDFLLWRGDSLDESDSDVWKSVRLAPSRVDSRLWETGLGYCDVKFFEHDVCVALACDNGHSDAKERFAEKADNVDRLRRKQNLPFWM